MEPVRSRIRRMLLPSLDGEAIVPAAPPVPAPEIFRRFWPYARPLRRYMWLLLPLLVLQPAIQAATIWLFKLLVDEVIVPHDFGPFLWIALAYLGLTLAGGLTGFGNDYLSTWVGQRFLLALRTRVFSHVQGLSQDFFDRRRLGDVVSRLTGDVSAIETFMLSGLASAVSNGLRIVFFVAALFYLQWMLAIVALVVAPVFWVAARYTARLVKETSREKRRRSGSISAVAEESFANVALVQASNRQDTEIERFHRENLGSFAAQMAATRLRALFNPLIDLVELAGVLVVIGVGTWQIANGRLTLGGLLAFLAYLSQLYRPVRSLSRLAGGMYAAASSAERIIEFLDEQPSVVDRPNARRLGRVRGLVEFDDVSFRYPGAADDALSGVSFSTEPGRTLALVGASGAGKSTVGKLLLRFYDPGGGQIRIDGVDLRDVELRSLRDNVSVLLQETLVFDGTVWENIAYGRPGATDAEVRAAAESADAHEFVRAFPDGYSTRVGQRGRLLSGGQRQRIAIARAMIRSAPVLLLDEPTTGLDTESGERILEPLRSLMAGSTTIIISHSLATVRYADWIVVLDRGRVVETGDHLSLVARNGTYARLHRLHQDDGQPSAVGALAR